MPTTNRKRISGVANLHYDGLKGTAFSENCPYLIKKEIKKN